VNSATFGYRTIVIDRSVVDEEGHVVTVQKGKQKGKPIADPKLRVTEDLPLLQDVQEYFETEVKPHLEHAWMDTAKVKVGYEILFDSFFHVAQLPRPLPVVQEELRSCAANVKRLLEELSL
jgi:type I restriction enzyme M protein